MIKIDQFFKKAQHFVQLQKLNAQYYFEKIDSSKIKDFFKKIHPNKVNFKVFQSKTVKKLQSARDVVRIKIDQGKLRILPPRKNPDKKALSDTFKASLFTNFEKVKEKLEGEPSELFDAFLTAMEQIEEVGKREDLSQEQIDEAQASIRELVGVAGFDKIEEHFREDPSKRLACKVQKGLIKQKAPYPPLHSQFKKAVNSTPPKPVETDHDELVRAKFNQIEGVLDRYQKGKEISEDEKLRYEDIAYLENRSHTPEHKIKARNLLNKISKILSDASNLAPGDIGITDNDKNILLKGESQNIVEKVFKVFSKSPYVHAQAYSDKKIHHVIMGVQTDSYQTRSELACAYFRVYPQMLLPDDPDVLAKLKKEYGVDYEKKIEMKFQQIQKEIFDMVAEDKKKDSADRKFEWIENGLLHMAKTGLANLFVPLRKTPRKNKLGFNASHQRVYTDHQYRDAKMHCAEFIMELTLAGLGELEKQLQNECGIQGSIITFPFSKHDSLKRMGPTRLIKKLNQAGAITQAPPNPAIVALFKEEETRMKKPALFKGMVSPAA